VSSAPSPKPTAISSDAKPAEIPSMFGTVRQNPKFTPDASRMKLLGPGVIEVTKA
jgi:hypothetical protein